MGKFRRLAQRLRYRQLYRIDRRGAYVVLGMEPRGTTTGVHFARRAGAA